MKIPSKYVDNLLIGAGAGLVGAIIAGLGLGGLPRDEILKMCVNLLGVFGAAYLTIYVAQEGPKRQQREKDKIIRGQIIQSLADFQKMMKFEHCDENLHAARGAAKAVKIQIDFISHLSKQLSDQSAGAAVLVDGLREGVNMLVEQLNGHVDLSIPNIIRYIVAQNNQHFNPNIERIVSELNCYEVDELSHA